MQNEAKNSDKNRKKYKNEEKEKVKAIKKCNQQRHIMHAI